MSGGVDSAVAAYLMKAQGYDVIGVTLRLAPEGKDDGMARSGRCCSTDDMLDARLVCEKIGIPFYAIDARQKFKDVVFDPFVKSYLKGMTPIPCLSCNHEVKFGDLFLTAQNLNADLATGHYARVMLYKGIKTLATPIDMARDQTYYLYGTSKEIISRIHFPLGEMLKPYAREIAKKIGLIVHDKKDSHEICFVPDGDHGKVIERVVGEKFQGQIVDEEGTVLGTHDGIHRFTVGQRRGLGVAVGERAYVADLDPAAQKVVLGNKSSLSCQTIKVTQLNLLVPIEHWPPSVKIKIRARSTPEFAKLITKDDNDLTFSFDEPNYGVSLGQAAVLYDDEYVLGGGIITARLDGMFPREIRQ